MIHILPSVAIAALADGKTAVGTLSHGTYSWSEATPIDAEPEKICTKPSRLLNDHGIIAALTYDSRILAGHDTTKLDDITPSFESIMGAEVFKVSNICVRGRSVIAWSDLTIGLAVLPIGSDSITTYSCTFESEIELISVDVAWCLVKTRDNRLFGLSIREQGWSSSSCMGNPLILDHQAELVFHDIANVREVHAGDGQLGLVMSNGSAFGCEYYGPLATQRPMKQMMFPTGETVLRVVNAGTHMVYLTASLFTEGVESTTGINVWISRLYLMQVLKDYVIENVLPVSWGSIIVQCKSFPTSKTYIMRVSSCMGDPNRIIHLPALDGLTIVSVTCGIPNSYCCFVTDDGKVYWSHNIDSSEPTITRDSFFDANPIAAERTRSMIGSAGSVLNDA